MLVTYTNRNNLCLLNNLNTVIDIINFLKHLNFYKIRPELISKCNVGMRATGVSE